MNVPASAINGAAEKSTLIDGHAIAPTTAAPARDWIPSEIRRGALVPAVQR